MPDKDQEYRRARDRENVIYLRQQARQHEQKAAQLRQEADEIERRWRETTPKE